MEELQRNKIERIVSEELSRHINEKKEGSNKTKNTKEVEVKNFYNDDMTNGAELARKICPKNWSDDTKRSYVSKLFGKNKNPRKPSEKDIEKGHNAID